MPKHPIYSKVLVCAKTARYPKMNALTVESIASHRLKRTFREQRVHYLLVGRVSGGSPTVAK